ncbi:ABC transporter permease [Sphaerisporangium melleum]|uniref:ABC transporter permease n=1 Tax=Sphaerisporangium melleum TaxID=321316 RepID=A0A917R7L6_9ACTN|nr:carbohydrate ABC transporter permease [Sphaerisporangium melleum]GGK93382.1 ABC transporter permease [Sphaerisporangium melleum]GII73418.1 ABC transporter permease [Sphaerisporangium melleum]
MVSTLTRATGPRTRTHGRGARGPARSAALHATLIAASLVAVFPVAWLVLTSLKPRDAWQSSTVELFNSPSLDNYLQVLTQTAFLRWLFNSLLVAAMTTVLGVVLAATTGYAVSRFRFPGHRSIMWMLLITQMFPVAILIVPIYNLLAGLGLINQFPGLVVAYLTSTVPFCAWMMKGYFDTVPVEIDEAGRVDGLTPFGTFWRLILPLSKPGLAVAAFYSFITAWAEVAYATAFMTGDDKYTLAVGLGQFVGQHKAEWGLLTASSVLIAAPAAVVFLLVQRHLVTGLTAGATKS